MKKKGLRGLHATKKQGTVQFAEDGTFAHEAFKEEGKAEDGKGRRGRA